MARMRKGMRRARGEESRKRQEQLHMKRMHLVDHHACQTEASSSRSRVKQQATSAASGLQLATQARGHHSSSSSRMRGQGRVLCPVLYGSR